ncbi:MAG: MltA domain-containing protein [Alphaproteobacteria bacterium]|nr:MltA domain-containing protein [Alphaproteobacteria bacterium]
MRGFLKVLAVAVFVVLPLLAAFFLLEQKPDGLVFRKVQFADLPGWAEDDLSRTLPALYKSCDKILSMPSSRRMPGARIGGRVRDWEAACQDILLANDGAALREVLLRHFQPLEVSVGGNAEGTFTGYYETLLHGSDAKSERYATPLYVRPPELVSVDLGVFRPDLKGRRIAGEVKNGKLIPFADRGAITSGALEGRDLELLWVDDPVDAFFLHIQGSGRVRMPDGSLRMIGYHDQNGHAYYAVGRTLIEEGEVAREDMSMQAIRVWLNDNPDRMDELMNKNRSFIFFRDLGESEGPFGSAAVPLTARRSLAVDRKHLPLHAPVWLSTSHPDPDHKLSQPILFNHLMVAQDTGGAINGEIRGDVFWGFGEEAELIAGPMNNKGRYWLLLPKALAQKAAEG